jgi:plasmid stabilization system protein ParE
VAEIYNWRARQSTEIADRIEAAIFAAADWLSDHSKFGAVTDEAGVRRWPMTDVKYTIFYVINGEATSIDILRVLSGRQVKNLKRVSH